MTSPYNGSDYSYVPPNAGGSQPQGSYGQPGQGYASWQSAGAQPDYTNPQLFSEAYAWLNSNPQHSAWLRANLSKIDLVNRVYFHLRHGYPKPHEYNPIPQAAPGFQWPPGGFSGPPPPPPPPPKTPPPQGSKKPPQAPPKRPATSWASEDTGDDFWNTHNNTRSQGQEPKAKRSLFGDQHGKRKSLFRALYSWLFSSFTQATGTQEFVDQSTEQLRQSLEPAKSFWSNVTGFFNEYEETHAVTMGVRDLFCTFWKHMIVVAMGIFVASYGVHIMENFPNYMETFKMLLILLLSVCLHMYKRSSGTMILAGVFAIFMLSFVPTDSFVTIPDEKLENSRVYQAMDMCMKRDANKFVMEGWPLLDQVIQYCMVNKEGNQCKHLVKVSRKHISTFHSCLKNRVIFNHELIEPRTMSIPSYDIHKRDIVKKIVTFQEVKIHTKYMVYAVINRLQLGHYFLDLGQLDFFKKKLIPVTEKTMNLLRYIPAFCGDMAGSLVWLTLLYDMYQKWNGPITRYDIANLVQTRQWDDVPHEEKVEIRNMVFNVITGVNDIFYVPPAPTTDVKTKRYLDFQRKVFQVDGTKVAFEKYEDPPMDDDPVGVKPRCTDEETLKRIMWNMHPDCPLGNYCREAINAHVTQYDTSLCPKQCAKEAFSSACNIHFDDYQQKLSKAELDIKECHANLTVSTESLQRMEYEVTTLQDKCRARDEPPPVCPDQKEAFEEETSRGRYKEILKEESLEEERQTLFDKDYKRRLNERIEQRRSQESASSAFWENIFKIVMVVAVCLLILAMLFKKTDDKKDENPRRAQAVATRVSKRNRVADDQISLSSMFSWVTTDSTREIFAGQNLAEDDYDVRRSIKKIMAKDKPNAVTRRSTRMPAPRTNWWTSETVLNPTSTGAAAGSSWWA